MRGSGRPMRASRPVSKAALSPELVKKPPESLPPHCCRFSARDPAGRARNGDQLLLESQKIVENNQFFLANPTRK